MARQPINHGTSAGDGTGESLFDAFQKVNENETELYAAKPEMAANAAAFPGTGETTKLYIALDTGIAYRWTGSAYLSVGGEFVPGSNDYAGIMVAVNACVAAGGGTVKLLPVTYAMGGNSLPMTSGVNYVGSGYSYQKATGVLTGTVLSGDGTAPCFADSKTDSVVALSANDYAADIATYGGSISGMAINGFTYGVKSGAKWRPGVWYYSASNLFFVSCSAWAMWMENMSLSDVRDINVHSTGFNNGIFLGSSSGSAYNNSNSHIENVTLNTIGATTQSRFIVASCRAPNTVLNDLVMHNIQVNSGTDSYSTTGTPTGGGSANISVATSAEFPLDIPVTVTVNANGLTKYRSYFVVSSSANVIQIAHNPGGTPITFSTTAAVSLITFGYPFVELATSFQNSSTTGCQIQPFTLTGLDFEQNSTCGVLVVNGQGYIQQGTSNGTGQGTTYASQYALRGSSVIIVNASPSIYDVDWNAAAGSFVMGHVYDTGTTTPFPGDASVCGFLRSFGRGSTILNLASRNVDVGKVAGLAGVNPSGGGLIYPHTPIGQFITTSSTASLALYGVHLGSITYTGTATATWTLPTLSGAAGGAANTYLGGVFEVANGSASAVDLTLNTGAGQGFNKQAKTSYVLGQGASISVRAQTNGTNYWWQVVGNNGAV